MKIDLVKLIFDDSISYKILNGDYCCTSLQISPMINIVHEYATGVNPCYKCPETKQGEYCKYDYNDEKCPIRETIEYQDVDEDGFYLGMMIHERDIYDAADDRDYPIHFCPFCGEKIEINIVKTIDVTQQYLDLKKQREELWDKCRKTDSKKEESMLAQQVHQLDKQIDEFYGISSFDEKLVNN